MKYEIYVEYSDYLNRLIRKKSYHRVLKTTKTIKITGNLLRYALDKTQ